jgi:hypothetical protein
VRISETAIVSAGWIALACCAALGIAVSLYYT